MKSKTLYTVLIRYNFANTNLGDATNDEQTKTLKLATSNRLFSTKFQKEITLAISKLDITPDSVVAYSVVQEDTVFVGK